MRKAVSTKTATTTKTTEAPTKTPEKSKEYYNLKIPRFNFKDNSLNMYLVIVLVIFAFLLGMLTNKVLYLENQVKNGGSNNAANAQNAGTPEPTIPQVVKVDNGKLPLLGDKNAKVTIVEFSDFQCPFCKQFVDDTYKELKTKYIDTGKVKFSYRHYPLTSIHPNAQLAGEASECANEQGKFWEFHDKVFEDQDTWSPQTSADATTSFVNYSGELGLNADQFRACIESGKFKDAVDADAEAGANVQVDGTPAFFVNGYRLTGAQPFSEFERVIEEQLKK